jgi:hypothetical protein
MKKVMIAFLAFGAIVTAQASAIHFNSPPVENGRTSFINLRRAFKNASTDFSNISLLNTEICVGATGRMKNFRVATSCGNAHFERKSETEFSRTCSELDGIATFNVSKQGLQHKSQSIYYDEDERATYYEWYFQTVRVLPNGDLIIEKSVTGPGRREAGGLDPGYFLTSLGAVADVGNKKARVKVYYLCKIPKP